MAEDRLINETAEAAAVAAAPQWFQTRAVLRVILIVLFVGGMLWMLYELKSVMLLLVLSIFFAYLIAPLVELVHTSLKWGGRQIRIPRVLSIFIVYVLIFGSITLILVLLTPRLGKQITLFAEQAPKYITSAQARAQGLSGVYDRMQLPDAARKAINGFLTNLISRVTEYTGGEGITFAAGLVTGLIGYLPWLVLIPILAFFLLRDVDSFRRSALAMLPRGRWRWRGDEFFQDVNSTLAAYIRAQLSACVIISFICTIGFLILGVPYWLALGVFAGLLEFIPLAGPLTVAIVAMVIAGFHSVGSLLGVFIFLAVLRIVEDYIIYPRLIGQGIHLHPLAVILAILCGAELAGVAGIFLAIPVIAIATVSYRHWLEHRGSEGLVADILKPATAATAPESQLAAPPVSIPTGPAPKQTVPIGTRQSARQTHPLHGNTAEEMARERPDLTTGELKIPRTPG